MSHFLFKFIKKIKEDVEEKEGRHKFINRLQKLMGSAPKLPLHPGEAWSDAAIAALKAMRADSQSKWLFLLLHCQATLGSSPSAAGLKKSSEVLKAVGPADFKKRVLEWFPLVDKPRTQPVTKWPREGDFDASSSANTGPIAHGLLACFQSRPSSG